MAVHPIAEVEHLEQQPQPRLRLVPTPEQNEPAEPPPAAPTIVKREWHFPTQETIAVLSAIAAILAVRLILLVAVLVGGYLAYRAVEAPGLVSIIAVAIYYIGVVMPMVGLTLKKG